MEVVHRKTKSHFEFVARGTATSVKLVVRKQAARYISKEFAYPLLDILGDYDSVVVLRNSS